MRSRHGNDLSVGRYYRMVALLAVVMVLTLFLLAPGPSLANGVKAVQVTYVFSPTCSVCEHSGPVIRGEVENSRSSGIDVRYVEYTFSSREGMDSMGRFGLDSVPAIIVDDHAIRFEDFNGDTKKLAGLLRRNITEAAHYRRPVTLERKIVKNDDRETVNVVTCVTNVGDAPVYTTVRGGLCEGVKVVSGDTGWQGNMMPGEKRYVTYEADVDNVKALPPQTLTYSDSLGDHSVLGQETPVYILKKLSLAAVFLAGLVAGVNPCLLAVMAFVSAMALSMKGRRIDIFINLLAFCAGLLAIYLLIGISFLNLIERLPSIAALLKAGIIVLLIGLAGFAFYEAYQLKKNPDRASLFRSFLDRYKPLYKKYCLAANFGLGGAFGLIKMPCVGGIYIAILGAIVESHEVQSGLFYLTAYNIGVIFPVLALGALLVLGLSPGMVDEFRKRNRFALKLATGAILMAMAAGFLLNVI